MAADATFFFDTNIDAVVGQIRAGLEQIAAAQSAVEQEQGKPSNDTARTKALEEYNAEIQRTIQKLGELNHAAKNDLPSLGAKNLSAGAQTLVTQADRELGRIAARNGLSLEVATDLRKNGIGQLVATANRELKAAKLVLPVEITGTRRISSGKDDFAAAYVAAAKAAAEKAPQLQQRVPPKQLGSAGGAGKPPQEPPAPAAASAPDPDESATQKIIREGNQLRAKLAKEALERLREQKQQFDAEDPRSQISVAEFNAALLRGAKKDGTARQAGFDKQGTNQGVYPTDDGKFLQDTRFGITELYQRVNGGFEALLKDTEPFIRAQEALGAAMARDTEAALGSKLDLEKTGRVVEQRRQQAENDARLRDGAQPGNRFKDNVYQVSKSLVSDQSAGQLDFSRQTPDGYRKLQQGTAEYFDAMIEYTTALAAEAEKRGAAVLAEQKKVRDAEIKAADARVTATQKRAVSTFKGLDKQDVAQAKDRDKARAAAEAATAAADKEELAQANARLRLLTSRARIEFKNLDKSDNAQVAAHEKARKEVEAAQKKVDDLELKAANDRLSALTRRARKTFAALDKADDAQEKKREAARKAVDAANAKADKEELKAADDRLAALTRRGRKTFAALDKADAAQAQANEKSRKDQEAARVKAEADRVAAEQQAVRSLSTQRLTADRLPGERFAPGVVNNGAGFVTDTRDLRGQGLEHYKRASDGLYDQITAGDKLAEAEERYAKQLDDERNQLVKRADAIGKARDLQLAATSKAQEDQDARENLRRLSDPSRKGGLAEGAIGYSSTGVANIVETEEDGVQKRIVELYRRIGDGLHKLADGSQAYNDELTKFESSGKGGRGIAGGFIHGLTSGGFGGNGSGGLEGLAQAAGTTAKYTALYSVLGLLQGALSQAGAEMVNFADSNTDLGVAIESATGKVQKAGEVDQAYVATLEGISITAGSNVGDVQDIVAAGIRTIGLDANVSAGEVKQLGADFAEQSQRMAILAKTDIKDASGNLRAISTAFDIPLQDGARINDALVTGKNVGGGDEKQTAQAVATAGEAAKNAGFTLEAISAIASRIQAATDQTGEAVGNKLSRIFSIVGGSAGQNAIAKLNQSLPKKEQIDLNATIYEQLLALSKLEKTGALDQGDLKKGLVNSLGGTSAAKEFITILDSLDAVVSNNGKGLNHAGAAAAEYQKKLQDLSVSVREFQGALKAIIVNIGNSGALDLLVAGFEGVVEALKAIAGLTADFNQLIDKFNILGAGAGRWAIRIGEVAAALLLVSKITKEASFGDFLGSFEKTFRPQAYQARAAIKATDAAKVAGATGVLPGLSTAGAEVAAAKGVGTAAKATITEAEAAIQAAVAKASTQAAATAATATAGIAADEAARVSATIIAAAEEAARIAATAAAGAAAKGAAVGGAESAAGSVVGASAGKLGRLGKGVLGGEVELSGARLAANEAAIGGIAAAGRGLVGLAGLLADPVTLAIGGFLAVAALKSKSEEVGEAMRGANRAIKGIASVGDLNNQPGVSTTDQANNYRNKASAAADAQAQLEKARGGVLGSLFKSDQNQGQIDALKAGIKYADDQATDLEKSATKTGAALNDLAVFGDPVTRTAQDISSGLSSLTDQGVSAEQRLRLFNKAIGQTGDVATRATSDIEKKKLARRVAEGLVGLDTQLGVPDTVSVSQGSNKFAAALDAQQPKFKTATGQQITIGSASGGSAVQNYASEANPFKNYFAKNVGSLEKLTLDSLPKEAGNADGSFSKTQAKSVGKIVAQKAVDDWLKTYNDLSPADKANPANSPEALRAFVQNKVQAFINDGANVTGARQSGTKASLATLYAEIVAGTEKTTADLIANLSPGDFKGKIAALKAEAATIKAKLKDLRKGEDPQAILDIQNGVLRDLAQSQVDENEKIRSALQVKAKTDKEVRAIGAKYFQIEFNEAAGSGNLQLVLDVLNRGSKAQIAAVKKSVEDTIAITQAEIKNEEEVTAYIATLKEFGGAGNVSSSDAEAFNKELAKNQAAASKGKRASLKQQKGVLDQFNYAIPDNSINTRPTVGGSRSTKAKDDPVEVAIAKRNAGALDGAKLDAARRKLQDAKDRFDEAAKKSGRSSQAYYDALKALNQAKYDAAQAELDYQNNANLAAIDLTNPVAVAKAALKDSKARLAQARRDADKAGLKGERRADFLNPLVNDVRSKQAELENTATSEYLSNAETSLRLGRISHSTYMSLLKAKRDQLQVEYDSMAKDAAGQNQRKKLIDSISETLKSAADELQGQFNIGDIKVPTPYEVRRYLKTVGQQYSVSPIERAGPPSKYGGRPPTSTTNSTSNSNVTNNVTINGADFAKAVRYMEQALGINGASRNTTTSRRT